KNSVTATSTIIVVGSSGGSGPLASAATVSSTNSLASPSTTSQLDNLLLGSPLSPAQPKILNRLPINAMSASQQEFLLKDSVVSSAATSDGLAKMNAAFLGGGGEDEATDRFWQGLAEDGDHPLPLAWDDLPWSPSAIVDYVFAGVASKTGRVPGHR